MGWRKIHISAAALFLAACGSVLPALAGETANAGASQALQKPVDPRTNLALQARAVAYEERLRVPLDFGHRPAGQAPGCARIGHHGRQDFRIEHPVQRDSVHAGLQPGDAPHGLDQGLPVGESDPADQRPIDVEEDHGIRRVLDLGHALLL